MFKKYRILKWILITCLTITAILFCFGFWFMNLLPPKELKANLKNTQVIDLPYLSQNIQPIRGKILAFVTSTDIMGSSTKSTGYELTELSRAYYVFTANGFEVDIASPLGGKPNAIIDDMGAFDYAFLNDSIAQYKTSHTIAAKDVVLEEYQAVFFAGGKGAMFDFPNNKAIQNLIKTYYQSNKVIGAVCHGPAALTNVILDNGKPLVKNKKVSSFTNEEELLLISDAKSIFPFLLQDKLTAQGAIFEEGIMYLEKISHDKNLITGQNPWSTWALAETMIKQLGYIPKQREITDEENAVKVLFEYEKSGTDSAKEMIKEMLILYQTPMDRVMIAKHSIVAGMKGDIGSFFDLVGLVSFAKECALQKEKYN